MKCLLTALALCLASTASSAFGDEFSFAVIGKVMKTANDDTSLARAIAESDADNLAFVVVNGFKRADEPCSDALYQHRLELLSAAKNGLFVSLSGDDWAECRDADGRPNATARLARLRELFFVDDFSHGATRIPLLRHSNVPKFRSYVENAMWEIDGVLFATINLPADNNHYRFEAGRNSEFEDRAVANRDWLRHLFSVAIHKNMRGIVLVCDGDPLFKPPQHLFGSSVKRDGFSEIRQQLTSLTGKFSGKVLIVHNRANSTDAPPGDAIAWHGNLGELAVNTEWVKLTVKSGKQAPFAVAGRTPSR